MYFEQFACLSNPLRQHCSLWGFSHYRDRGAFKSLLKIRSAQPNHISRKTTFTKKKKTDQRIHGSSTAGLSICLTALWRHLKIHENPAVHLNCDPAQHNPGNKD